MSKKLTVRRNFIKIIILGALLLLTPITFMWRRRRSAAHYQWVDVPGENIPLPDEVSGQVGSEVCASSDGQIIAVAGNRIIPQDTFKGGGKKREPALTLLSYKHFIYLSRDSGKSFECVYRSPRSGVVASMALSPVNSHQIAFISIEFPTNLPVPEAEGDMAQMARDQQLRTKMAEDYAYAVEARDFDIVVYILDTEKESSPRKLCTLDHYPWQFSDMPKTDMSRFNAEQLKWLNEMKSFRESGIYVPWELRLHTEKQAKSVTWLSDGNALLICDGASLTKVDLSGNKSPFYNPGKNVSEVHIPSNIHCRTNGDVSFVEVDRSNRAIYLTRLDKDGNVLSKTQGAFSTTNTSPPFDETPAPLVGEHKIVLSGNTPENMHSAFLRSVLFSPNMDDWKDTVDWKDHMTTYNIDDPNRVQFYYIPKVFINEEKEILLFKRRAYLLHSRKEFPNCEATPWTLENAAAPWVELRKMKIS